jgi:glyoxylase-like metal-dependent hydrolase (beta-lactamase superfamily II)
MAIVIDPGEEADRLIQELEIHNLQLGVILATHAHLDHLGAVDELQRQSGAPFCLPEGEREVLGWLPDSYQLFGLPARAAPHVDQWLSPDLVNLSEIFSPNQLGFLDILVHPSAGHSPGGVCYQIGNHWFVGDTLFQSSVGRVDLPGGDWSELQESLRALLRLPDDTFIYPGHGPETTIGREKMTNPFLKVMNEQYRAHV